MRTCVLSVIGDDRPGLVEAIASVVATHDGNWEQSQLARMAGKFAGIIVITVDEAEVEPLIKAVEQLEGQGLAVGIDSGADSEADAEVDGRIIEIDIVGPDHAGIVQALTAALAEHGATIVEFESVLREAPMTGGLVFDADLKVIIPPLVDVGALRDVVEEVGRGLMVEIDFH